MPRVNVINNCKPFFSEYASNFDHEQNIQTNFFRITALQKFITLMPRVNVINNCEPVALKKSVTFIFLFDWLFYIRPSDLAIYLRSKVSLGCK